MRPRCDRKRQFVGPQCGQTWVPACITLNLACPRRQSRAAGNSLISWQVKGALPQLVAILRPEIRLRNTSIHPTLCHTKYRFIELMAQQKSHNVFKFELTYVSAEAFCESGYVGNFTEENYRARMLQGRLHCPLVYKYHKHVENRISLTFWYWSTSLMMRTISHSHSIWSTFINTYIIKLLDILCSGYRHVLICNSPRAYSSSCCQFPTSLRFSASSLNTLWASAATPSSLIFCQLSCSFLQTAQ